MKKVAYLGAVALLAVTASGVRAESADPSGPTTSAPSSVAVRPDVPVFGVLVQQSPTPSQPTPQQTPTPAPQTPVRDARGAGSERPATPGYGDLPNDRQISRAPWTPMSCWTSRISR